MTALTLTGADGSVWNLLDADGPVQLVGGMGGLHLPPSTSRWSQNARRSGRRFKDAVSDSRSFTMNVRVGDGLPPFRTGDDWRALDSDFWAALRTDAPATLAFGDRTLSFRLDDSNEHEFPTDPSLLGKATYAIACIADRPEWLGSQVTAAWDFGPETVIDYYNGVAKGPPFNISAPSVGRRAVIANDGDLPSYPTWIIVGPATTAEVGVGNHVINIPFSLLDGQVVIIDTEAQTITDRAGRSLWPQMGAGVVDFAPVPPGGKQQIHIGIADGTASSTVEVRLTPRYRRAW